MTRQTIRRALGVTIAVTAVFASAPAAQATDIFGITQKGELAKFDSKQPSKVKTNKLKGLPDGVKLVGIDQRPSNGKLYGIGDDSTVYRISNSGDATAIDDSVLGTGFGGLGGEALDGKSFGVDFNPVPDAIRIVSDTGQNLRVSPETGQLIASDGDINGAKAQIVDAGYTNSQQSDEAPEAAVLYVLDALENRIYTQSPPNDGTLVNPVDLDIDITKKSGFDLVGSGEKGFIADGKGKSSKLYRVKGEVNIGLSGNTKSLGKVKAGSRLVALAVSQPKS